MASRLFTTSLDVLAVRSTSFHGNTLRPSGTDDGEDMLDSPILGRSASAGPSTKGLTTQRVEALRSTTNLPMKAQSIPPLNVKKLRRRALISGVPLVLPESPIVPPAASSTPSTSLTFTANWDATLHEFSFTPVTSGSPSPSPSPRLVVSPIPYDVDADLDDVEPSYLRIRVSPPRRSFSTSSLSTDDSDSLYTHSRKPSTSSTDSSTIAHGPAKVPMSASAVSTPIAIDLYSPDVRRTSSDSSVEKYKRLSRKVYHDDDTLTPWSAFEKSCWDTLDQPFAIQFSHPRSAQPYGHQRKSTVDKPLPDVPIDSMDFYESDFSPVQNAHPKPAALPGRRLRAHFNKLLGNMHRH